MFVDWMPILQTNIFLFLRRGIQCVQWLKEHICAPVFTDSVSAVYRRPKNKLKN
jgi:hypothetical protein